MMEVNNCEFRNSANTFALSGKKALGHYNMSGNHLHDYYELYYLVSGERYYFVKDRTFYIKTGDLVLIPPHELHKTTDTGVPGHERVLLYFTEDYMMPAGNSLRDVLNALFVNGPSVIPLTLPAQNQLEDLLQKMLTEVRERSVGFELALQGFLLQLLVNLTRYQQYHQNDLMDAFEHPSQIHQKISEIVQYINQNFYDTLTLSILSERFYISPYYLSRIFKETTGFTFVEYLSNVRIKEAQKLLRDSRWKVIQVAEKVGFGNIAHFGRVFKNITGKTPLQYRKQQTQII